MTQQLDASAEDCGCAPTVAESRRLWGPMSRRTAFGIAAAGVIAAAAIGEIRLPAAYAADYPSWDDVLAAKSNESSKAGEIANIEALIQQLQDRVATTRAAAIAAGEAFHVAQQDAFDAAYRADELQRQADEQSTLADEASKKAQKVAVQLYRNGGEDTSLDLFFNAGDEAPGDLLARLGSMDKLSQRNATIYQQAVTARDAAQSLSDQAAEARKERDRLQKIAEEKMLEAQRLADEAQAALADQEANLIVLQAQLQALRDTTTKVVADYEAGVAAEKAAREERERLAKEEAERIARENAENNPPPSSGGGGGGGGNEGGGSPQPGGGTPNTSGWVRPNSGGRTSGYGPRYSQCGPNYCASGFHYGVDLAAGCWSPIYAASAGTVDFAGYNGGYGNYVRINHGGGIGTGYAHIADGGINVSWGQWVEAGQVIAYEGNTGNSFGCHLHFEVYINGGATNPIDYMAGKGISV